MGALAALLIGLGLLAASPAQARWLKAESARFTVYSDGDRATLESYTRKLETLDSLLRTLHGLPDESPPRKLPVYLVANDDGLRMVWPGASRSVAGFYRASDEDIFAVAIRGGREEEIVFHEYAHHFMMQHFPFGYQDWMVEGWADFYGAVTVDTRHVTYGKYNELRARQLLYARWIPLSDIVTRRSRSITDPEQASLFYGEAWILVHYFLSDPARRQALDAALREIATGKNPVAAVEAAAGQSLTDLEKFLKEKYLPKGMPYSRVSADAFPPRLVRTTELSPAADELLLLGQRMKIAIPDDQKAATLALVRRAAAKQPDDPLSRFSLARAELQYGDRNEGRKLMEAVLQAEPQNVTALLLMAADRLAAAEESSASRLALLREANGYLARAAKADPDNYTVAFLAARVRREAGSADYPTDADMDLWSLAYAIAPQYGQIRFGLAEALLRRNKPAQAILLLEPLANDPHGDGGSEAARRMIEEAKARLAQQPAAR